MPAAGTSKPEGEHPETTGKAEEGGPGEQAESSEARGVLKAHHCGAGSRCCWQLSSSCAGPFLLLGHPLIAPFLSSVAVLLQMEGGGQLLGALQSMECRCVIEAQAVPCSITWRRRAGLAEVAAFWLTSLLPSSSHPICVLLLLRILGKVPAGKQKAHST